VADFPTLEEVLAMHAILLAEFGGAGGLRDRGALESALMRPQLGYYGSLVAQAAALMESLAQNHPFVDGNKRVAFFVTDTFLRLNGHFVDCDGDAAHADFMALF
jgi:death on curing protein